MTKGMPMCDFTDNGTCAAKIEAACICSHPAYQLAKHNHERPKPEPYSRGCQAREIPGASCQRPNCDC